MGVLDDAIREHLDLKRRHGADPADLARMEREALGPAVREAAPAGEAAGQAADGAPAPESAAAAQAESAAPTAPPLEAAGDKPAPGAEEGAVGEEAATPAEVEEAEAGTAVGGPEGEEPPDEPQATQAFDADEL